MTFLAYQGKYLHSSFLASKLIANQMVSIIMDQEIDSKLDSTIASIKNVNICLERLEKSWQAIRTQLYEINTKLSTRCNHLESEV